MNKNVFRWLLGLIGLGLILVMALPAGATPSPTPRWLPFDGSPTPAQPALTVLTSDATAIVLEADLPGSLAEEVKVEGQPYTRLYGEGYGHPATVGLPDLPVLRRDVEIPFGATVALELVQAEYADYRLDDLDLYPIYPLQPPLPKVPGAENRPPTVDRTFYESGSRYPASPLALGETYIVRGHRVQTVEVWPVAYDPTAGTVRLYSRLTFRLRLSGSDLARTQALAERYASPVFEAQLSRRILNYNQGRPPVEFAPDTPVGYLIVTADAYYDAMLPFVSLKESRGFDVTMVRCSEIGGCSSPNTIQNYIQNAYQTWPIPPSYVLLVGDTNTIAGWNSVSAGEITDLYYSTMDAPGTGDWHPDIGRGRFPVRSAAQTTIMVNKYFTYANLTGQEPWLKTVAFPATCDNYIVAEGTHNYVINTHTLPGGYTGTFPNNPQPGGDKLYCVTYGATAANIQASLNQGRWAVIYSGHGGWDGWEMNYGTSYVQNLTNYGMFPFVASHACITGDFAQPEVFGETWVLQDNKAALVFWGSSDSSFWDEDDVLERAMFDSLFTVTPHPDVARMTDDGLAAVEAAYPISARYYWETYNVLGDPAVKIFLEPDLPTFTLGVNPTAYEICQSGSVTSTVQIGSILGYSETVYLEAGPLPPGISATFAPPAAQAPFISVLTLDVANDTPTGDYAIIITATDQVSRTLNTQVTLRVVNAGPEAPTLLSPPDGATGQPFAPTFEWGQAPWAADYRLQVDRSPLFGAPLVDVADIPGTGYTPTSPLEGGRCYWWHVQGENTCGAGPWADPFHFATSALAVGFYDDMESGSGQWSHQAAYGTDHWQISTAQSHSPTHAWFVPDDSVVTDSRLWNTTPVPVGGGSSLTFWHRYQFEGTSYDGAVLEISTNGGGTWTDLGPYITSGGYNGTISTCCSNPLGGRQAWTGDLTTWTEVTVDLSAFAGQNVNIRWRIGCDSSISDVGWYIDDVQITSPLPPNLAPAVLSITPNSGSAYEQTPVVIEGSNLIETPAVQLGDTWLLSVTLVSSTTLEAVVPAGMPGGVYTLTLYNGDCQEATLANAFTVTVECITPTVTFVANSPVELGQPIHFTSTVTGTAPFTYTWDFGDGLGSSTDPNPVYTYTTYGPFTVTLTVENLCGQAVTGSQVEVLCFPPTGQINSTSPVTLGQAIYFTATVAGTPPLSYTWDFGGPGVGTGLDTLTPVYTYTLPGDFLVSLVITGPCGSVALTETVAVKSEEVVYSVYLPLILK